MEVIVFKRPGDAPIMSGEEVDIRISYGDYWVDFQDGNVIVSKDTADGQGSKCAINLCAPPRPATLFNFPSINTVSRRKDKLWERTRNTFSKHLNIV